MGARRYNAHAQNLGGDAVSNLSVKRSECRRPRLCIELLVHISTDDRPGFKLGSGSSSTSYGKGEKEHACHSPRALAKTVGMLPQQQDLRMTNRT